MIPQSGRSMAISRRNLFSLIAGAAVMPTLPAAAKGSETLLREPTVSANGFSAIEVALEGFDSVRVGDVITFDGNAHQFMVTGCVNG
jgi:hypothetical protein